MLTREDISFSDEELSKINTQIKEFGERFTNAGEVCDGMIITLSFIPGLGRSVNFSYSGSTPKTISGDF